MRPHLPPMSNRRTEDATEIIVEYAIFLVTTRGARAGFDYLDTQRVPRQLLSRVLEDQRVRQSGERRLMRRQV